MDYLIYPRYLLAISLIGALRDCTTYPPAPPVPSHPREGGARLSAFLFLHMCLVDWSGSPWGELAAEQTEGGGVKTGNWELQ